MAFLWQKFPVLTLGRGRLEIESDAPILGTALTLVPSSFAAQGSLFSSLPLLPSPYSYTFSTKVSGIPIEGEIGLWVEGPFAKGYVRLTKVSGTAIAPETFLSYGKLQNGTLIILGFGTSAVLPISNLGFLIQVQNFNFSLISPAGTIVAGSPRTGAGGDGTILLTKRF